MTITPFTTFNSNYRKPFEHYYETPVYDPTDLVGDFDDDGNPTGDGTPDNQEKYCITNKTTLVLIKIALQQVQGLP